MISKLLGLLTTAPLFIVYVLVFVPVGLLRQAFLPDPMDRKLNKDAATINLAFSKVTSKMPS